MKTHFTSLGRRKSWTTYFLLSRIYITKLKKINLFSATPNEKDLKFLKEMTQLGGKTGINLTIKMKFKQR